MARYLYRCAQCEKTYEVEKSMNLSARPEPCPVCQRPGERVFTPPSLSHQGGDMDLSDPGEGHTGGCEGCGQAGICGMN